MKDGDEHDGHRLGEIEQLRGLLEDLPWPRVEVGGLDVLVVPGSRRWSAERAGVGEDDRVVVHVDDGTRRGCLGEFVVLSADGRPVPMSRNWRIPAYWVIPEASIVTKA